MTPELKTQRISISIAIAFLASLFIVPYYSFHNATISMNNYLLSIIALIIILLIAINALIKKNTYQRIFLINVSIVLTASILGWMLYSISTAMDRVAQAGKWELGIFAPIGAIIALYIAHRSAKKTIKFKLNLRKRVQL